MSTPLFGATRTVLGPRHALVAPDGHIAGPVPGWHGGEVIVLLSPRLGGACAPGFVLLLAELEPGGGFAADPGDGLERFAYVLSGTVRTGDGEALGADGYALLPAGRGVRLRAEEPARLLLYERPYEPAAGAPAPEPLHGRAQAVEARPFLGDEGVMVRPLLPAEPAFDLSMAIMTYRPGACLPFVETHEPEHGIYHLTGSGILRLEERFLPVRAGDAVWMGPYCPQWFAAVGDAPASYLLYKDGVRGPWPRARGSTPAPARDGRP